MKFIYSLIILLVHISIIAQTTTQNYAVTTIPFQAVSDPSLLTEANSNSTIQYYDGSGRLSQTVQRALAPSGEDMITALEYDALGRLSKNWLPAVVQGNNGAFYPGYASHAIASNLNDAKPFSTTGYEASPLNRVISQAGPGNDWYANSKKVTTGYQLNGSDVKYFYVENDKLKSNGCYAAATLNGVQTTDEDGKSRIEYADKQGLMVLSRVAGSYDTYYVYDDLGNLRYVLPPLAADNLNTNLTGFPETSGSVLYLYAFIYHYDGRKRCIEKKLPGCEWSYFVYDKADRLILSQDGNQKLKNNWEIKKYDKFGRFLYRGIIINTNTRAQMESTFSGTITNESYTGSSSTGGYTCSNLTPSKLLTVHYYDNYNFLKLSTYSSYKSSLIYTTLAGYSAPDTVHAKTLLTGSCVYQINDSSKFELISTYFDKYGRIVQVRSSNHLAGYDFTYNLLDFTGKATKTYMTNGINGTSSTNTEVYSYTFDKAQRLVKTTHKINSGDVITLSSNSYNKLGQLISKTLGGISGDIIYIYNVRGWITDIIGPKFTENLYYNKNTVGLPDFSASYNGNISGMKWNIPGENPGYEHTYSFTYDVLDRLTKASYCGMTGSTKITGTENKYNELFAYDKMGNINSLIRYENCNILNDLVYTSTGNQLKKVNDVCSPVLSYGSEAFNDRAELETEYLYDKNGNNTYDANSGISTIKYNLLNLPEIIQFTAGHQNKYIYGADGRKLTADSYTKNSIIVVPQGAISPIPPNSSDYIRITTAYINNKVYQNDKLKQINTSEGYWQNNSYYYYLKDHLGNVRVVINSSGNIVEKSHYYPSGIRYYSASTTNSAALPYRYNCKEFLAMNGLNWYDYGARFYDPQIGRWHVVDPLAEESVSWSPYNYTADNPIRYIDPDGMAPLPPNDYFDINTGQFLGKDKDQINNNVYLTTESNWKAMKGEEWDTKVIGSIAANGDNMSDPVASKVMNYYYEQSGYDLGETVNGSIDPEANEGRKIYDYALARTSFGPQFGLPEGKFNIEVERGEIGNTLINRFDFINLFKHERGGHGSDFLKSEYSDNLRDKWERNACLIQVTDPSWMKVSNPFREHMIKEYGNYIPKQYQSSFIYWPK